MQLGQLAEKYQISEAQLNMRVNFLGLKPIKTLKKSPFFSPRDIFLLDDLHKHLANEGKFSNYMPPSLNEIVRKTQQVVAKPSPSQPVIELENNQLQALSNQVSSPISNSNDIASLETHPRHPKQHGQSVREIFTELEIANSQSDLAQVNDRDLENNLAEVETCTFYPEAITKEIEEYFALNQRLKYNGILEELANRGWGLTAKEIHELTGSKPTKNYYQYDCFMFVKQGKIGNKITWRVVKQPLNQVSMQHELPQTTQQSPYRDIEQEILEAEQDFVRDLQLVL